MIIITIDNSTNENPEIFLLLEYITKALMAL